MHSKPFKYQSSADVYGQKQVYNQLQMMTSFYQNHKPDISRTKDTTQTQNANNQQLKQGKYRSFINESMIKSNLDMPNQSQMFLQPTCSTSSVQNKHSSLIIIQNPKSKTQSNWFVPQVNPQLSMADRYKNFLLYSKPANLVKPAQPQIVFVDEEAQVITKQRKMVATPNYIGSPQKLDYRQDSMKTLNSKRQLPSLQDMRSKTPQDGFNITNNTKLHLKPLAAAAQQEDFSNLKTMQSQYKSPFRQKQVKTPGLGNSPSKTQNSFNSKRGPTAQGQRTQSLIKTSTKTKTYSIHDSIIQEGTTNELTPIKSSTSFKPKFVEYSKTGVVIGQGKFSPIELIIYKKELKVLKMIPKGTIDKVKRIEHLKNEKRLCYMLGSLSQKEWFIKLEETFTDAEGVNFIFDYMPGHDLYKAIQNNLRGNLNSKVNQKDWVRFYAAEILIALELLHKNKIIYRDLKPENVVIDHEGHIKLIDFGFAKQLTSATKYRTFTNCGTLGYTAPEVLTLYSQGYSFQADIWSYGILLCELFQGTLPFDNKDDPLVIEEQISQCDIKMPREADQTARDLLTQIFQLEPNLRISLQDIKQHKFFADIKWQEVLERGLKPVPFAPDRNRYRDLLEREFEVTNNQQDLSKVESPKRKFLGDFTLYKVNKEFENF